MTQPQAVNAYLTEHSHLEDLKHTGQEREQLEQIASYVADNKPSTMEDCIVWARLRFEEKFNNEIQQLLCSLPKDAETASGQLFWSTPKRAPDPLIFDANEVSIAFHTV